MTIECCDCGSMTLSYDGEGLRRIEWDAASYGFAADDEPMLMHSHHPSGCTIDELPPCTGSQV